MTINVSVGEAAARVSEWFQHVHQGEEIIIWEQLQAKLDPLLNALTPEIVASITGYPFILEALSTLSSF